MEESIPNQMICSHCRSIFNAQRKIVIWFNIASYATQTTCGNVNTLFFHCLACEKALKFWDGVLRHKVTQTHVGKLSDLSDGINGADDYISSLPNDNADTGMINDNEEGGTDVETDKDDWLLRLGKNNPTIGTPVLSLSDLKDSAGFDKNSSSPRYYWEEYQKPGLGLKQNKHAHWLKTVGHRLKKVVLRSVLIFPFNGQNARKLQQPPNLHPIQDLEEVQQLVDVNVLVQFV